MEDILNIILLDLEIEYEKLVKASSGNDEVLKVSESIAKTDIVEFLLKGKTVIWDEPNLDGKNRYYRYNSEKKVIESSKNNRKWLKTTIGLDYFKNQWSSLKWLILE